MTEREKLIQLIGEIKSYEYGGIAKVTDEGLADYLLKNGVIVPPVNVGDTVYHLFQKQGIVPRRIRRFQLNSKGLCLVDKNGAFSIDVIGKTVFLTCEEAEKALAERGSKE